MKTIMRLLLSLQHFEQSVLRAERGRQFTPLESKAAGRHLDLVREMIPKEALLRYEEMKEADRDLMADPEIFAMAVVVATYRTASPALRRELVARLGSNPGRIPSPRTAGIPSDRASATSGRDGATDAPRLRTR